MEFLILIISAIFVNNFILSQFLGICPFLGVSKKTDTALGMGLAVIFVMGVASIFAWLVQKLLVALHVEYLQTISFILVIAALVQLVEMVLKKFAPALYSALGVYLPLITTNCAVLGVAILNVNTYGVATGLSLLQFFLNGVFSGVGFTLAILLLAGIREKLEYADVPKPFRGFPITLITACIMSMGFVAFSGMVG
ncbi:MAG: RnfABCDGE type electron transport complex subunit A [Acidaminococcus sp.]|nr:RnfABCDGE type electron transport complex subunit A [Acidaminococcus sp.]MDD7398273.1 RnfABCDGE type electron transport complex subunit A [Bacillota bacterium]MDY4559486.1 RnfABCDGE type electron transport complex subunit A [Eubacteriales bacterium]MDY5344941.1 RnfABCDGE type electron transport complex subunit A [Eubacteriales bacterium]